jgi:putative PEP-CTERM system TPR-repeat lipoprotein
MASGEEERGLEALQEAASLADTTGLPEYYLVIFNLQKGRHTEAMEAVEQFSKKHPGNVTAYNMRGAVYLDMGDEERAIAEFEKGLELSPGQVSASHNLAMLATKNGDLKRAHDLYVTAWKHNPGHPRTAFYLANAKEQLFGASEAREFLENVPENIAAAQIVRLKLAELYLAEGSLDKAMALASMPAVDGSDNHPAQLMLQAQAKILQNSPGEALAIINRLLDANPRHARGYYLRGVANLQLSQNQEARTALETSYALYPADPGTAALLARVMTLTGDVETAQQFLGKLPETSRKSPDVMVQRGWIALTQGQFEQAARYYREIPAENRPVPAETGLATAMIRQRDLAGAIAVLKDARSRHPRDNDIRRMLANTHIMNAEHDQARRIFSEMVDDGVRDPAVWNNLAWLLTESAPKKALEYSTLAYESMPRDRSIADTHVKVLLANKQFGGAERVLNEMMIHDQNYLDARLQLAYVMGQQGRTGEAITLLQETRLMQGTDADKERVDKMIQQLDKR